MKKRKLVDGMHKLIEVATPIKAAEFPTSVAVIVDGDTMKIVGKTIRIVEIDTPKTFHSRCENELVLGLKSKQRLRQLVDRANA